MLRLQPGRVCFRLQRKINAGSLPPKGGSHTTGIYRLAPAGLKACATSISTRSIHALTCLSSVERHRTLPEHDVVKRSNVEARPSRRSASRRTLADLELANLVAERLPRPHNISIDLDDDVLISLGGIFLEETDRLVASQFISWSPVSMTRRTARHMS